jgi:hypothetical protein
MEEHGAGLLRAIPVRSLFDAASLIQIALAIGGAIVASRFEWLWLRRFTMAVALKAGTVLGMQMVAIGPTTLRLHAMNFEFAMVCTWIMAYAGTVSLIWNPSQSLRANLLRLGFNAIFIFGMNIARIELCFAAFCGGAPWTPTHAILTGGFGFLVYLP